METNTSIKKKKRLYKTLSKLAAVGALAGLALYLFAPHPPKTPKSRADRPPPEAYLNELVGSGSPPGLSIVVVNTGQIVYNRAFGMADGPRYIAASPETVYHWWSMTKIPTAIGVLQLVEQGKLSLDDPVHKHLSWFNVQYPSESSAPITIRHLLNHSSGLPDTIPAMIGWVHYDDTTRNQTEIVKQQLPNFDKLRFEPGSRAAYSNLNYMVLGSVIEAVSGQGYEKFIADHILRPLGMSETDFIYTPSMAEFEAAGAQPIVHFYTPLLPFLLDIRSLVRQADDGLLWMRRVYIDATPSTGLIGPATDAAWMMLAFLNDGELDGARILQPGTLQTMTAGENLAGEAGQHGLGWFIGNRGSRSYIQHAGGGPGFATLMRLYPDEDLGIVLMANGTDLDRDGLADLLAQMDWSEAEYSQR